MNLKGCGRKWSLPNMRCCSGSFLDGLRKTMKNLNCKSCLSVDI